MIIDHTGVLFFNNNIVMRTIGRIAFPLYLITFADGYTKTSNRKKYIGRIFLMAIITEPLYSIAFLELFRPWSSFNVLFTFSIALAALMIGDKIKVSKTKFIDKLCVYMCAALIGDVLKVDYGMVGILSIILAAEMAQSEKFKNSKLRYILPSCLTAVSSISFKPFVIPPPLIGYFFVIILLLMYNGEQGQTSKSKFLKSFLFISYPLHLLIIVAIELVPKFLL